MERRLTAILAADVVSYGRLMGEDEAGTLVALKAHRAELIEPKAAQYSGRIIKLMGDGTLMEFPSVVDAVAFAVELQNAMQARNANIAEAQQIHYRIGINIGDVIVEDDDIYGDGVNVAARLEGLSEPGGICIPRNVRDQIRDKLDLTIKDLGEVEVKNIARPIRAFRVVMDDKAANLVTPVTPVVATPAVTKSGHHRHIAIALSIFLVSISGLTWWQSWGPFEKTSPNEQARLSQTEELSITVLAFKNLSGDPSQEYLSDAISEDITTELSRFSDLVVISRESAFSYKGQSKTAKEIGQELDIRYLLEGSVRRSGDNLRVTAQLIDTIRENHVWSEKYDRKVDDVLVVQDDIVRSVVSTLGEEIWRNAAAQLKRKPLENFEAYDYRLRGSEALHKLTIASNEEARGLYKKALKLDPEMGLAYVGLAWTHLLDYWFDVRPEALDVSDEYTQKAAEVGAPGYHVHRLLAEISSSRGNHDKALEHNARAIELNPNDGDLLASRASLLAYSGQLDEARTFVDEALRRNPHHPDWYGSTSARIHYLKGNYEQALAVLNRIESPVSWDHQIMAASYAQLGNDEKAKSHAQSILAINPEFSLTRFIEISPYRREADRLHILDGLSKAGLPE